MCDHYGFPMSIGKFTLFFTELHAYVRGEQLIITTEISIDPDADLLRLILFDANKWPFLWVIGQWASLEVTSPIGLAIKRFHVCSTGSFGAAGGP